MIIPVIPTLDTFHAKPPIHILAGASDIPRGLAPSDIKAAYGLPTAGGSGTIAIVSAYHHPDIATDLAVFSAKFGLSACAAKDTCLTIHAMKSGTRDDSGWDMETALDAEWAHAIAPGAKIAIVEAASDGGTDLIKA